MPAIRTSHLQSSSLGSLPESAITRSLLSRLHSEFATQPTLLVLTIVFWNFAVDWLGYHIPLLQRFTRPPPLQLIKDGQLLRRNMRQEMITTEELLSQLRQQGIEDPNQVKMAYIEGDGRISIIRQDNGDTGGQNNDPRNDI